MTPLHRRYGLGGSLRPRVWNPWTLTVDSPALLPPGGLRIRRETMPNGNVGVAENPLSMHLLSENFTDPIGLTSISDELTQSEVKSTLADRLRKVRASVLKERAALVHVTDEDTALGNWLAEQLEGLADELGVAHTVVDLAPLSEPAPVLGENNDHR